MVQGTNIPRIKYRPIHQSHLADAQSAVSRGLSRAASKVAIIGLFQAPSSYFSQLLIIWLLQQAPIGSVGGCPDQRFPRRFASFSPTLPPRRRASSIWRLVAGQMGLFAFDAGTKDATNW